MANSQYELAYIIRGIGRTEEVIMEYNKAIEINPHFSDAYDYGGKYYFKQLGLELDEQGRIEEVLIYYTKAIEIYSQNPKAYQNRGNQFILLIRSQIKKLGKINEAINDYTKSIQINPQFLLASKEDAIIDYIQAIQINPLYVQAYILRGKIMFDIRLPYFTDEYYIRGLLSHKLGRLDDAIVDYTKVIELNPPIHFEVDFQDQIGNALCDLKRKEDALIDYTKAIEIDQAYTLRGHAFEGLERIEEAIMNYSKIIEICPEDVTTYYLRDNGLKKLGKEGGYK